MCKKIKLFADCKCELGESPMYNKKEKMLYWHGFHGEIYRKPINDDPNDFECFQLSIGRIGSMVFTDSEYMLLFGEKGTVWKWKANTKPILYKNFKKSLFNDVITDKKGRVYCGMLADNYFDSETRGKYGYLMILENGELKTVDEVGTTPNGIRFSPELDKLYFAVTDEDRIYEYKYNVNTGELLDKKVFAENCSPDGITIDSKGNLWVTDCRPGGPLICYNPNGEIIEKLYFDTHRVISVAFGGENNDLMFVTTACKHEVADGKDGGVFVVEDAGIGAEEYLFHLD